MNLIVLTNIHGNLYFLKAHSICSLLISPFTCNTIFHIHSNLCHMRVGHPSHSVHKIFASQCPSITYNVNKYFSFNLCHLDRKKNIYLILRVLVLHLILLIFYMLVFGVLTPHLILQIINIFLILLMITLDLFGLFL